MEISVDVDTVDTERGEMFMAINKQMPNHVRTRKFRKMGEIMTVVNQGDRVLFGVDVYGRIFRPSPPPTESIAYKYETLRKRLSEGKSWWEEKI